MKNTHVHVHVTVVQAQPAPAPVPEPPLSKVYEKYAHLDHSEGFLHPLTIIGRFGTPEEKQRVREEIDWMDRLTW